MKILFLLASAFLVSASTDNISYPNKGTLVNGVSIWSRKPATQRFNLRANGEGRANLIEPLTNAGTFGGVGSDRFDDELAIKEFE